MKVIYLAALLGLISQEQTSAIQLNHQTAFVDDIVKALAESDKQEEAENKKAEAPAKNATALAKKPAHAATEPNKTAAAAKKDEDIPMDTEAVKAYSSVIADAAEDSEPATPVVYTETDTEKTEQERASHAPKLF